MKVKQLLKQNTKIVQKLINVQSNLSQYNGGGGGGGSKNNSYQNSNKNIIGSIGNVGGSVSANFRSISCQNRNRNSNKDNFYHTQKIISNSNHNHNYIPNNKTFTINNTHRSTSQINRNKQYKRINTQNSKFKDRLFVAMNKSKYSQNSIKLFNKTKRSSTVGICRGLSSNSYQVGGGYNRSYNSGYLNNKTQRKNMNTTGWSYYQSKNQQQQEQNNNTGLKNNNIQDDKNVMRIIGKQQITDEKQDKNRLSNNSTNLKDSKLSMKIKNNLNNSKRDISKSLRVKTQGDSGQRFIQSNSKYNNTGGILDILEEEIDHVLRDGYKNKDNNNNRLIGNIQKAKDTNKSKINLQQRILRQNTKKSPQHSSQSIEKMRRAAMLHFKKMQKMKVIQSKFWQETNKNRKYGEKKKEKNQPLSSILLTEL